MNIFVIVLIQPLANGLILFYRLLGGNMGLAIISFSLLLRIVLNPLTKPYMNSMKKMKEFAPQLDKLKKKYGKDNLKLARAQADFYKERGIKPGAGCLPYLLQIVVLIAFFNVFSRTLSNTGGLKENFNPLLYESLRFKEEETVNTKFLYLDLTKPDIFKIASVGFSLPGPILFLSALAQLFSTKAMSSQANVEQKVAKETAESTDDIQVVMQRSMTYTFPLITLVIGMRFASALALYWLVFSLSQLYQQVNVYGLKVLWLGKKSKE